MQKKQKRNQLTPKKKQNKNSLKIPIKKTAPLSPEKKYKNSSLNTPSVKKTTENENWREQYEALNNKYQFLMAEYANYKKNNIKHTENLKKYEGQQLTKKLIDEVIDDFDRAMKQQLDEQNIDELKRGIHMIYDRFMNILKNIGIKKASSKGQLFDPSVHCAVDSTPSEETPPDHIVHVIKEAYFFHDRLIRPAEVIVSRKLKVETPEKKDSE